MVTHRAAAPGSDTYAARQIVNGAPRDLPIGSSFDALRVSSFLPGSPPRGSRCVHLESPQARASSASVLSWSAAMRVGGDMRINRAREFWPRFGPALAFAGTSSSPGFELYVLDARGQRRSGFFRRQPVRRRALPSRAVSSIPTACSTSRCDGAATVTPGRVVKRLAQLADVTRAVAVDPMTASSTSPSAAALRRSRRTVRSRRAAASSR